MPNAVKGRAENPTASERGLWIARLTMQGVNGTALAQIITAGKSRGEIWELLREYARTVQKSE